MFHTWQRCVRSADLYAGLGCVRANAAAFVRANKCEKEGEKKERKKERKEQKGWRRGGAHNSNVGDVQVALVANTLGRLRIMMPYCIQIRIPTVACVGIWA